MVGFTLYNIVICLCAALYWPFKQQIVFIFKYFIATFVVLVKLFYKQKKPVVEGKNQAYIPGTADLKF